MEIPLFIDFETKNGIHKHLELATKRKLIYPLYNNYNRLEKLFFMRIPLYLQLKLNLWCPLYLRWGKWKELIPSYSNVVVTASYHTIPLVKYLNKHFPSLNINVFYFNPVAKDVPIIFFRKLNCKLWSFDKEDCRKYDLNYNNQFVVKENYNNKSNEAITDVIFVGSDKGRLSNLLELEKKLNFNKISTEFHIVATFGEEKNNKYSYKSYLTYEEIVNLEAKSKVILDYVQCGQKGQTIRPLEAIFQNKKVITNNQSITEEPYYNKKFFFILNKDNFDNIYEFVNDYVEEKMSIHPMYEIEGWLKNFVI
ncbi:hypothetical protein JTF06_10735 [Desemzia sp. RIT804]|uniref:hypothetical protein n=1 Tax=Desemzia sp. RIT 804 TaxID=2810209 RepID=UPI00194F13C7|nr:hypothetical protein [Desemzia sp. RIT 804]MBM6615364.1 hypothetical protein [Desemzia sp. RIT 804]